MDVYLKKAKNFFKDNPSINRPKSEYFKHVRLVRKYALMLCGEYDGNKTIVEIAAILHDIGADAGYVHAYKSAEIAKTILYGMAPTTKKQIISAIMNHSAKKDGEEFITIVPIEDKILRDADGIAFLEHNYLPFLKRKIKRHGLIKGKSEALIKIHRMLDKITTKKGIEIAKKFYNSAKLNIKNFD